MAYPRTPFTPRPNLDGDPLAQQLRTLGLYVMAERHQDLADDALKAKSPYPHYLAALGHRATGGAIGPFVSRAAHAGTLPSFENAGGV